MVLPTFSSFFWCLVDWFFSGLFSGRCRKWVCWWTGKQQRKNPPEPGLGIGENSKHNVYFHKICSLRPPRSLSNVEAQHVHLYASLCSILLGIFSRNKEALRVNMFKTITKSHRAVWICSPFGTDTCSTRSLLIWRMCQIQNRAKSSYLPVSFLDALFILTTLNHSLDFDRPLAKAPSLSICQCFFRGYQTTSLPTGGFPPQQKTPRYNIYQGEQNTIPSPAHRQFCLGTHISKWKQPSSTKELRAICMATWRIIPFGNQLATMISKSPKVVPLPNGLNGLRGY